MTNRRAAIYFGGGALLLAYLAGANSAPGEWPGPPRDAARHAATVSDASADDIRAEARQLRERLAAAPVPDVRTRNPFSFAPLPDRRASSSPAARAAVTDAPIAVPLAPVLSLMGVAEDTVAGTTRRTAIISGPGDALFIVAIGERVADRYEVSAIGADAVELKDTVTGGFRRLAMR